MSVDFKIFSYKEGEDNLSWGKAHGETYSSSIKELSEIRLALMQTRNPKLDSDKISLLAKQQLLVLKDSLPSLYQELEGISFSSGVSKEMLVVLNNYTDFRDISFFDQGCSTVSVIKEDAYLFGQTWDMHRSAKDYIILLDVPLGDGQSAKVFSLVGCLGMAGISSKGIFLGVNNLSLRNTSAGLPWCAAVRDLLTKNSLAEMDQSLKSFSLGGGRNFLFGDNNKSKMWEVGSGVLEEIKSNNSNALFHTNHSLCDSIKAKEMNALASSTTKDRYQILEEEITALTDLDSLVRLLRSHKNFPRSVCSHVETGANDPSFTCGGFACDLKSGKQIFWKGCKEYDLNFSEIILTNNG